MGAPTIYSRLTVSRRGLISQFDRSSTLRIAAGLAIPALGGVTIAVEMPRGPVTSTQALTLMVLGAFSGLATGLLLRSGLAVVHAPLANILAFEIFRRDAAGPTVDGIHLDTTFGVLAALTGRGVYVILAILPIVAGVGWGLLLHRSRTGDSHHSRNSKRHWAKRLALYAATLVIAALAIWISLPASTPAVADPSGVPRNGGVAELAAVTIGGVDQWLEIRGASENLPVLLYLSGGPGQSDLALSRALLDELTADFIVVGWDQRGTGKSYAAFDPEKITPEVFVADAIEVTNYLRQRFAEEKIYLMGESWGSLLGVLTVQERPDLFHAYIGSGQMVSPKVTDQQIYEDLIAEAARQGKQGLVDQLTGFGPPPYGDLWAYGVIMQNYPLIEGDYDPPQAYLDRGEESGVGFWGIMGSEYNAIDKINVLRGLIDVFATMYPQLQEIDFRVDAPTLEVPVYLIDGVHELAGRRDLAHAWFEALDAPVKMMYTFENGGHAVAFEHADELHQILLEEILPATYPGAGD